MKGRTLAIEGSFGSYRLMEFSLDSAERESLSISPGNMQTKEDEALTLSEKYSIGRVDKLYPEYGTLPYSFLDSDQLGDFTDNRGQDEFAKLEVGLVGEWRSPSQFEELFKEIRRANPKQFKLDQVMTCLRGIEKVGCKTRLNIGPGRYSDSFYSNGSEGRIIPSKDATLRSIVWEQYKGLPEFVVYNNNLGNAGMVLTDDGYYVFVLRGTTVSVNLGVNCTASGAVRWNQSEIQKRGLQFYSTQEAASEANDELGEAASYLIWTSLRQRIFLELGVGPDKYDFTAVGLIRELPRGGKPELMFLINFRGSLAQLVDKIANNTNKERAEVLGVYAQEMRQTDEMLRDPKARNFIQHKGRANLVLANRYLGISRNP
ncbi:MAG: hypothetical protein HYT03_00400 [Candidatus Harrisonbacteria bacterium]|nr:hypothetical protein [Candidatus Harrisonbacteria bacterium]